MNEDRVSRRGIIKLSVATLLATLAGLGVIKRGDIQKAIIVEKDGTIVITQNYLDFEPLTADPTLKAGRVFFRGDVKRMRFSPDGQVSADIVDPITMEDTLGLGGKPEPPDYNKITVAGTITEAAPPPAGQYIYLQCITANAGADGDVIALEALDEDGVNWRRFLALKFLGNTTIIKAFPNIKLDKVRIGGSTYNIKKGDGSTKVLRAVGEGTGPWEATLEYYFGE